MKEIQMSMPLFFVRLGAIYMSPNMLPRHRMWAGLVCLAISFASLIYKVLTQ